MAIVITVGQKNEYGALGQFHFEQNRRTFDQKVVWLEATQEQFTCPVKIYLTKILLSFFCEKMQRQNVLQLDDCI